MQDEIKLLKEKNDDLNKESRRLHDLYNESLEKNRKLQIKLESCENGNQDAMVCRKELDSCRDELLDEKNSNDKQYKKLRAAKRNIKTLEDQNEALHKQYENEKIKTLSELSQNLTVISK